MPQPIYLDHNATAPLLPEALEAMRACWAEPYLNPASQHEFGRRARRVLEDARDRIGELLGAAHADRVIFTSGGTESNNLAIRGLVPVHPESGRAAGASKPHLVISPIEHPSITAIADELELNGCGVGRLPIDADGTIRVDVVESLLLPNTALVAALLGHNETGVLQPVAELASVCARHSIPLHTDAAQVAGKLAISFRKLGVATLSIAAHKFGGPLGVGALIVRGGTELRPQLFGGFQQAGTRPGTEAVALVLGMCRALERWEQMRQEEALRLQRLRDEFERTILTGWPDAVVIGQRAPRLPHTSNIAFVGLDRQALFMALDQAGVACSTGSACASGSSEPSPVHRAMGLVPAVTSSALRFSFGVPTTADEASEGARRILACCNNLRR